jgi:non-specific serine/threonine protein kinase
MSRTIRISPSGRLAVEPAPEAQPALDDAAAHELEAAFAQSSAHGLLHLASKGVEQELPPALVFWRELAQRFFHAVCQLGENAAAKWGGVAPPPEEELHALAASAPPMQGLEYLSAERLRALWDELRELAAAEAKRFPDGPEAYLRSVNPLWHLLGRVTFHLAENKRDERRPFAFLATYTHRLSAKARLQHQPLGEALKEYAGERNRDRLAALLEPVRRAAESSPLVRELLESKSLFQPQAWSVAQAHRFLKQIPQLEESGVVVRVPDWWRARRPPRPQVQVTLGEKQSDQRATDHLLDFSVSLALDGEELTEDERRAILESGDGLMLLRGKWVEVDRQQLEEALDRFERLRAEHADGLSFIEGMRLLAGAALGGDEREEEPAADWARITAGGWFRDTLESMRDPARLGGENGCRPGRDLRATLRPYQSDGVRWLWFMTRLGLGACLADDMGLGKTIQVIDLLLQRVREQGGKHPGPSLLVVPASLVGNWKQELARFAPSLRVFFAHRSECDADELARISANPRRELANFDLVVTTYGLVRRAHWLGKVDWQLVVLDEAQAIKNHASAQTKAVKKLKSSGRIVLTGTPVENQLGDLWSLFDFCSPGLLGNAAQFKQYVKRLNKQQDAQAFGALRRLVRPYILRRMKTDPRIVPDLPEKTEMRAECGLSKKQAALYEHMVEEFARRLEDAEGMSRRGMVLTVLMQLKQICNHPAQLLGAADFPPADSGKFQRLAQICEEISQRQEKVLVFTQFQSLTEPLAEYLGELFGRKGLVLHGGTAVKKRSEMVRQFQDDAGPPFFVISLKAGGSGLNLTAASHVVHFDRWWNPAVENQATDRAFRIGQKRNVLVHKFVCRGTLEERIDNMLREKQALADKLLAQGGETLLTEMSNDELLGFVSLDLNRATAED